MVKIFTLLLSLFPLVFLSSAVIAKKDLPVETESLASETEIICFAAMDKWVCAPASDQQQAKAKAMRLVEEKEQQNAVVIKTMPVESQWQEAVIEESVSEEHVQETQDNPVQVGDTSNQVPSIQPVAAQAVANQQETVQPIATPSAASNKTSSQIFSEWQVSHNKQWTLQAVGTTNLPNLEDFITQNNLGKETMSIATTEVKGAPWHIVLVGLFDSRDQALAFKITAENRGDSWAVSAWPRPVDGIVTLD